MGAGKRVTKYDAGGNVVSVAEEAGDEFRRSDHSAIPGKNRLNDQVDEAAKGGLLGPLLAQMLGENQIRYSGPGVGSQQYAKQTMRDAIMREGSNIGLPAPQSPRAPQGGPGASSGGSRLFGAPMQQRPQQPQYHREPFLQKFDRIQEERHQDSRALGMEQKRGSMKQQLSQQLLQSILGMKGMRGLNDPQVTTQDTQAIGERGGVSTLMPIHSTETRTPGGQGRAQMMAQLLQAIQGMM